MTSARAWCLVAGSLITAFLARGPLYLSVLPPFEAWDEYQHLAYLVHLDEAGTIPVFNQSEVPVSLYPVIRSFPHSQWGGDQIRAWGARSYADYWNSPPQPSATTREPPRTFRLYQAQQAPLAYLVVLPIWRAFGIARPLEAIAAIRTANLLFVAAALVLFAAALVAPGSRCQPSTRPRRRWPSSGRASARSILQS